MTKRTERHAFAEKEFYKLKRKYCPNVELIFSFNNSKTKAGICYSNPTEIQLSNYFIKSPVATNAKVRDVILHELAHVMVGVGEMHNDKWKAVARKIGCTANVCSGAFLMKSDYKYLITCSGGCHTRKISLTQKYLSRPHVCRKHHKLLKIKKI
jgi:predicted SprT family Zn-dependent metalloprotease